MQFLNRLIHSAALATCLCLSACVGSDNQQSNSNTTSKSTASALLPKILSPLTLLTNAPTPQSWVIPGLATTYIYDMARDSDNNTTYIAIPKNGGDINIYQLATANNIDYTLAQIPAATIPGNIHALGIRMIIQKDQNQQKHLFLAYNNSSESGLPTNIGLLHVLEATDPNCLSDGALLCNWTDYVNSNTVAPSLTPLGVGVFDLALDDNGQPHIAYNLPSNSEPTFRGIKLISAYKGSGWFQEIQANGKNNFQAQDHLHLTMIKNTDPTVQLQYIANVAYVATINNNTAIHTLKARQDTYLGTVWEETTTSNRYNYNNIYDFAFNKCKINNSEVPCMAYVTLNANNNNAIFFAYYTTSWNFQNPQISKAISAGISTNTAMAIDDNGLPHIISSVFSLVGQAHVLSQSLYAYSLLDSSKWTWKSLVIPQTNPTFMANVNISVNNNSIYSEFLFNPNITNSNPQTLYGVYGIAASSYTTK